jgi:2-polyprenyl-3-methyl-5-hydroxy-6-metoxy-1,4-benzoquinol methylase
MDGDHERHYTRDYFRRWNYAGRRLGRYSMYGFARRYYAALVRRHAPRRGGRLLELGCGLGHLLALLQDDFSCVGIDRIDYGVEQSASNAPRAEVLRKDASNLEGFGRESFAVVVALHVVEHLPSPEDTLRQVHELLEPQGLFLFATPNPVYALRRLKDVRTDAIGIDETHINVQSPERWRTWCEQAGFTVCRHFGDGLWDVPYLPWIPPAIQFAAFGLPALLQVLTRGTWTPLSMGVNQVVVAVKSTRQAGSDPVRVDGVKYRGASDSIQ